MRLDEPICGVVEERQEKVVDLLCDRLKDACESEGHKNLHRDRSRGKEDLRLCGPRKELSMRKEIPVPCDTLRIQNVSGIDHK